MNPGSRFEGVKLSAGELSGLAKGDWRDRVMGRAIRTRRTVIRSARQLAKKAKTLTDTFTTWSGRIEGTVAALRGF